MPTEALFRDDAYLKTADATVVAVNDRGGIILDRTIFYATSGGQPGDTGHLERADGSRVAIAATISGETKDEIIHVPAPDHAVPEVGEKVSLCGWTARRPGSVVRSLRERIPKRPLAERADHNNRRRGPDSQNCRAVQRSGKVGDSRSDSPFLQRFAHHP